jgi:hypothetical protein
MDSVERNEARKKQIKEYWKGLAEKLKERIREFKKEHPGSEWVLNDEKSEDQFNVATKRMEFLRGAGLQQIMPWLDFQFTWDPAHEVGKVEVSERRGPSGECVSSKTYQISVKTDGEAFLSGSDGITLVRGEETVGNDLEEFLEKFNT